MGKRGKKKKRASAAPAVPAPSTSSAPAPLTAPAATTAPASAPPIAPVHSSTAPSPETWSYENFTGTVTLGDLCDPRITPKFPACVVLKGVWTSLKDLNLSTRTQTQTKKKNPKTSDPHLPRRSDTHLAILQHRPRLNLIDNNAEMVVYVTTGLSGTGDTDLTSRARHTDMTLGDLLIPNECTTLDPLPSIKNAASKPNLVKHDNYDKHPLCKMKFHSNQTPRVCDRRSWTVANAVTEQLTLDTEVFFFQAKPGEGTLTTSLVLEAESAQRLEGQAFAFSYAQQVIGGDGTGNGRGGGKGEGGKQGWGEGNNESGRREGGGGDNEGGRGGGVRRQGGHRRGGWNRGTSGGRGNRQKGDTTWEDGHAWYWCADGRGYRYLEDGSIVWCFPPGYVKHGNLDDEDHQATLDSIFAEPGEDPVQTRKNADIVEWARRVPLDCL
ncbi:hypothetical protein C8J57DRAFT_1480183 [Mycena rebaudengoi]|nr:hypothetical protein C8J57DRAFT_1480183 [Mycena rebaudengoi]